MNKTEMIAAMAETSGLSKKDCEAALTAFLTATESALKSGDKVQLVGFGSSIDPLSSDYYAGFLLEKRVSLRQRKQSTCRSFRMVRKRLQLRPLRDNFIYRHAYLFCSLLKCRDQG